MTTKTQAVIDIATRDLRACYSKHGILAGNHHFTDYWGRDGYFAALGSMAIGDFAIVQKMLKLFYKHQRVDGLIPYRVMNGPISLSKYLGKPTFYSTPRPTYRLRGFANEVLDGTTLTILYSAILGMQNGTKTSMVRIKKALNYLEKREKNNLLFDGLMAEWNDTAWKWGHTLYSNVIYWYVYDRISAWAKTFDLNWHKRLDLKKNIIAQTLRDKLWTGKYFADWYDYKRHDYFYPFGNCLAIVWGLANKKESETILAQCAQVKIDFTLESNFPKYPWWRIDFLQKLAGMGDYQNQSLLWWQPVTTYIVALNKMQKQKTANQVIKLIVDKVHADQTVYECYERTGAPVKRFLYSSEKPFAWGSGMILWSLLDRNGIAW